MDVVKSELETSVSDEVKDGHDDNGMLEIYPTGDGAG